MEIFMHVIYFLVVLVRIVIVAVVYENGYWSKKDPSKQYRLKEILANFFLGASYKLIDAAAIAIYIYALYDLLKPYGITLPLSESWAWFPLIYIMVDLFFYITHLIMHKVRWFWTGHVTHHSSRRYNYSVALRQNFTVVLNGALMIWWLPCALLGFEKEMVLLAMECNLLYQFLLHTEMPSKLDKLGYIFNTPSHHRVHHGCNRDQIDRNFAGTFIVWDKLFGTFIAEGDAGKLKYGITRNQPNTYNPFILIFHEWKDMLLDCWQLQSIKVFLFPPAWIDKQKK